MFISALSIAALLGFGCQIVQVGYQNNFADDENLPGSHSLIRPQATALPGVTPENSTLKPMTYTGPITPGGANVELTGTVEVSTSWIERGDTHRNFSWANMMRPAMGVIGDLQENPNLEP